MTQFVVKPLYNKIKETGNKMNISKYNKGYIWWQSYNQHDLKWGKHKVFPI